jgi:amino acid transporter
VSDALSVPDPVLADEVQLHRALGPVHLTLIGVGATIGAGIFVIAGNVAAEHAGPAVLLSFLVAATGCFFAALCYAELAAMIPQELQIVRHALGDVPLVGFFAAGEIARHHLYGYTGVLTVFAAA